MKPKSTKQAILSEKTREKITGEAEKKTEKKERRQEKITGEAEKKEGRWEENFSQGE